MATVDPDAAAFYAGRQRLGREVLGPILARFSRDLILWARATPNPADTAVLFAARGGWRLELVAKLFAARTSFTFGTVSTGRLMISRLLAMRGFLNTSSAAAEELARYGDGKKLAFVARLLLPPGATIPDMPLLDEPVTRAGIQRLLADDSCVGKAMRADVALQHSLLNAHIDRIRAGRSRILFVDTGLFGSMFRVLDEGRPDLQTALIMLGRCFYRAPLPYQRDRTFGLAFQCDRFRHQTAESAVIRHWYLFETLFEPHMDSITRLTQGPAGDGAECAAITNPAVEARDNPFFAGIMDYIDALSPADLMAVDRHADRAARSLARAILTPSAADVALLGIGPSEASPGDEAGMDSLIAVHGAPLRERLAAVREAHWQEGQARRSFPVTAGLALPAVALARMAASLRR